MMKRLFFNIKFDRDLLMIDSNKIRWIAIVGIHYICDLFEYLHLMYHTFAAFLWPLSSYQDRMQNLILMFVNSQVFKRYL